MGNGDPSSRCTYTVNIINHSTGSPLTTLQTMRNSLTVRVTRHVKCYSYHARTSVTLSGGGRNPTVHDPKPYTNI